MINLIINKAFLIKTYKVIKFFIQNIFLSFVFYITVSAIIMFMKAEKSFLKNTFLFVVFLTLFKKIIFPKSKDYNLFGKYTECVGLLIAMLTVIILINTLGKPKITFH